MAISPVVPQNALPHPPGIRVGCDLQSVAEISRSIAAFGDRYLARVFTPRERADTAGPDAARRLAARFAGKEAVLKLLGPQREHAVPWTDIEVRSAASGEPEVVLHGAASELAHARHIAGIQLSLTHDDDTAMAFAAAFGAPSPVSLTTGPIPIRTLA